MKRGAVAVARLGAAGIVALGAMAVGEWRTNNAPLAPPVITPVLRAPPTDAAELVENRQAVLNQWQHAPWRLPLQDGIAHLSSQFGTRRHPVFGGVRHHDGLDLAAPSGTPVMSAADGVVMTATSAPGYGRVVDVDHGQGWISRYAHLSRLAVTPGETIRGGHILGNVGSTGWSTGPHLHFEIYYNGRAVDPWDVWQTVARLGAQIGGQRSGSSDSSPAVSLSP